MLLPYLFKVLPIDKPLSVQSHPDKFTAIMLHKSNPKEYHDSNHKLEMCLALTTFECLIGFKEAGEIIKMLNKYPS